MIEHTTRDAGPEHAQRTPDLAASPDLAEPIVSTPATSDPTERVERALREVQATLDAHLRPVRHREFSPLTLIGAGVQACAIGLLALALLDWMFANPIDGLFTKIWVGILLQLMALTALLMAKSGN